MHGLVVEAKIGKETYDQRAETSIEVFESLYGNSKYDIMMAFPNISDVDGLAEKIAEGEDQLEVRWAVYRPDKDEVWSEWRTVDIIDFHVNQEVFGFNVRIKATDRLYGFKNKRPGRTWKEVTVDTVLGDIAKDYDLELDTDATSDTMNFLQCDESDYDFIQNVVIPIARENLGDNTTCDFMFYVDKGLTLIVKTRQPSKAGPIKFSKDPTAGIPVNSVAMAVHNSPGQYFTIGKTVNFIKQPFFFRHLESPDLGLKYDSFGLAPNFKKGPGKIDSIVMNAIKKNVDVEKIVRGRMTKPELYKRFRMAIWTMVLPKLEVGMEGEVDYLGMYCAGKYLIYAFYTRVSKAGAYTITYLERAGHKG